MSHGKFLNMIRLQASMVNNSKTMTDLGVVTGYDPINYLVTVEIYPADEASDSPALQTGWIPLSSPWVGNGWGIFAPPNIGDLIDVHYQAGSLQNAYASMRFYTQDAPAPNVPSGEFWVLSENGAALKFTNDGSVSIGSTSEDNSTLITIANDGSISITSSVNVTVTSPTITLDAATVNLGSGTTSAILNAAAAVVFNAHVHTTPGGLSGVPTTTMGGGDQTTNVFAS